MLQLLKIIKFIIAHPLNQDKKLESLARFVKWQLGSRLVPGPVVFDWINGARFLVEKGETGLTGNIYTGLHEFEEMAFLLHVLRKNELFVDVGANSGSYTILACAGVGALGYAFEPAPRSFSRLVANVRINNLDEKVVCLPKAVGDKSAEIYFTKDRNTMNRVAADDEALQNVSACEMTSLDIALDGKSPALLKIDVEGYETKVLEGAQETLRKPSLYAVILEQTGNANRYGFDESKISRVMSDCGFHAYLYNPTGRTLVKYANAKTASGNTLFIRDEMTIRKRLESAPQICINQKRI